MDFKYFDPKNENERKSKNYGIGCLKIDSFCSTKVNIKNTKTSHRLGESMCKTLCLIRDVFPEYMKNSYNSVRRRQSNLDHVKRPE